MNRMRSRQLSGIGKRQDPDQGIDRIWIKAVKRIRINAVERNLIKTVQQIMITAVNMDQDQCNKSVPSYQNFFLPDPDQNSARDPDQSVKLIWIHSDLHYFLKPNSDPIIPKNGFQRTGGWRCTIHLTKFLGIEKA